MKPRSIFCIILWPATACALEVSSSAQGCPSCRRTWLSGINITTTDANSGLTYAGNKLGEPHISLRLWVQICMRTAPARRGLLTAEQLRQILAYDADTGVFVWLTNRRGGTKAGDIAGYLAPDGYIKISVMGASYHAARLAYLYMRGEWPHCEIAHRNLNRADDRWENLGLVD